MLARSIIEKKKKKKKDLEIQNMVKKGAISPVVNLQDGFLSTMFLVPKKGGGLRPIINLKKLNEFIPHHLFKMEGIHMLKDLLKQGDFMAKRSEGRIFRGPNKQIRPKTPEVQVERQDISVQLPAFWAVMCSLGLYQGSNSSLERDGHQAHHLHGRHTDHGGVGDTAKRSHPRCNLPPRESRSCDQLSKIHTGCNEKHRVSRLPGRFRHHGAESPRGQIEEYSRGSEETPDLRAHHGARAVENTWENARSNQGDSHSCPILQAIASGASVCPVQVRPGLQHPTQSVDGSERGVTVVAHPLQPVEWAEPDCEEAECVAGNGRLTNGLGRSMPGRQDRGSLGRREETTHQLPRIDGSVSGLQMLLQGEKKHPCPTEDGQHIGSRLHQQDGRDGVPSPKQPQQAILAMVHGEGHLCTSTAFSRETEQHRGCRIQRDERQIRLETLPPNFPVHQQVRTTGSGPVCISSNHPATDIRERETRPRGLVHGCVYVDLNKYESICQSTVESNRQSPGTDASAESESHSCSSGMEDPSMVPQNTGNVLGLPPNHSQEAQPHPTESCPSHATHSSPTSRVDYLRRRYKEQQLSEEAAELRLSSWRKICKVL